MQTSEKAKRFMMTKYAATFVDYFCMAREGGYSIEGAMEYARHANSSYHDY